jgi:hypothetical protein
MIGGRTFGDNVTIGAPLALSDSASALDFIDATKQTSS